MAKRRKIWIPVILSLVAIIAATLLIYYFGAIYVDFNNIATKEFLMPGLDTSFVPQGLTYNENNDVFLISGYMSNDTPSRVYVVDGETGNTTKYFNVTIDGNISNAHFGGIASYDNTIWLTGKNNVLRLDMDTILTVENSKSVESLDEFDTNNTSDFVTVVDNKLIVGEFYREKSYETDTTHHITTTDGINKALGFAYTINTEQPFGLESILPEYAISFPDIVQGMCLNKNGDIVLSTSYSIFDSHLYVHKNILESDTYTTTTIKGLDLKTYILDSSTLVTNLTCPAMTEEIVLVEDKVYVGFENASKKYKYFNRARNKYVYSLDI